MSRALIGLTLLGLGTGLTFAGAPAALAQASRATTEISADKAKVTGAVVIDYNSRSERSQSNVDVYNVQDLAVADLMILEGRDPANSRPADDLFGQDGCDQPGESLRRSRATRRSCAAI